MLLYVVHRNRKAVSLGRKAQDGHLDFHTAPELGWCNWLTCCFTATETVGLLGAGTLDIHFDFHTAPELCGVIE